MRSGCKRMMKRMITSIIILLVLAVSPTVFAAQLETEFVKIPLNVDDTVIQDDARITKPLGEGPFPLIVMTHGTPRTAADRAATDVLTYFKNQSEYFAARGYAVVFVVRRGFGASTAAYREYNLMENGSRNYTQDGLAAAQDLKAAIGYMKSKVYIDPNRIILIGQSTGGHSIIAAASLQISGVIGAVNFAGGRGSYAPDLVRNENNLIESMGQYGKTSNVPTLWLYASNDHFFRPDLAQRMYKAYTENGGQAAFVALPAYGNDGHRSFVGNRSAWEEPVDQFLESLKKK